jgi:hypothetical protein
MERVDDLDHQNGHIFTIDLNLGRVRLYEGSLATYGRCRAVSGLANNRQYVGARGKVARNSHAGVLSKILTSGSDKGWHCLPFSSKWAKRLESQLKPA